MSKMLAATICLIAFGGGVATWAYESEHWSRAAITALLVTVAACSLIIWLAS